MLKRKGEQLIMIKCVKELKGLETRFEVGELYQVTDQDEHFVIIFDGNNSDYFTYEQMKESFIQFSKEDEFELLKHVAKPLTEYMNRFYSDDSACAIVESESGNVNVYIRSIGVSNNLR